MAGESLRERLSALSRGELIGVVAVLALALSGAGLWYSRSLPKPVEISAQPGASPAGAETPSPGAGLAPASGPSASPSPSPATLVVHVAGWVRNPGVYEFRQGDRVIDAVHAAGGFRRDADQDALNLAALLTDGEQVLVPQSAPSGAVAADPGSGSTTAGGSTPGALININTASATDLETLPGIGEVIGQRIVDYRTQNGPFATVDQLEDVSGIGPSILAEIHDLVTV